MESERMSQRRNKKRRLAGEPFAGLLTKGNDLGFENRVRN